MICIRDVHTLDPDLLYLTAVAQCYKGAVLQIGRSLVRSQLVSVDSSLT